MRIPNSPPPVASDYLDLLQTRATRLPPAASSTDATSRSAERVAPPAYSRAPRGSLIDIKA